VESNSGYCRLTQKWLEHLQSVDRFSFDLTTPEEDGKVRRTDEAICKVPKILNQSTFMGFRLSVKATCSEEAHSMHPHLHAKDGSHHYCFDGEVSSCSVYPYYSHRPLHAGNLFVMEIVVNAANFTDILL